MAKRLNLVTGASGFSGSHLVKMLLDDGQKVIVTDLAKAFKHPKNKAIFKSVGVDFSHPNCEVIPADLTKKKTLAKLFKKPVTHVFHTASLYDYSASMEILHKINVTGSVNFFEVAEKCPTIERFIHWSTCGVFGKPYSAVYGKKCNIPFTEDNPSPKNSTFGDKEPEGTHLVNDYAVTKWEQEQIAWKFHRENRLPITVVRPAPLYGPGSDYGHGGIILAINKGLVPAIPIDAKSYLTTSVHIKDMAGFTFYISDKDSTIGEDYNVVDDSVISYYEFMHYLGLLVGRRIYDIPFIKQSWIQKGAVPAAKLWLYLETRFNVDRIRVFEVGSASYMASSYWISNAKLKSTGYELKYPDVKKGMCETVGWFRSMGWLRRSYNPKGVWQDNM